MLLADAGSAEADRHRRHAGHPGGVPGRRPRRDGLHRADPAQGRRPAGRRQGRRPAVPDPDLGLRRWCCWRSPRCWRSPSSWSPAAPSRQLSAPPDRRVEPPRLLAEGPVLVISFRYHLVSIIGIFLAIALGRGGRHQRAQRRGGRGPAPPGQRPEEEPTATSSSTNQALRAQAGNADLLAQTFGGKIAGAALAKTPVVLLGAPGATEAAMNDDRSPPDRRRRRQGRQPASSSSKDFTDPQRANDIRSLATSGVHPIGLQLPTTDDAGHAGRRAARLRPARARPGHRPDPGARRVQHPEHGQDRGRSAPTAGKVLRAGGARCACPRRRRRRGDAAVASPPSWRTIGGPTVVAGDPALGHRRRAGRPWCAATTTAKKAVSTVDDADSAARAADRRADRRPRRSPAARATTASAAGADALLPGASS